jgi:hypothetical protein
MFSTRSRRLLFIAFCLLATAVCCLQFEGPRRAWRAFRANRYASRAGALAGSGAFDAARIACQKALALDGNCLRVFRLMLQPGMTPDPQKVLLCRSRIADLDPGDTENLRVLAVASMAAGRFELANQAINDLVLRFGENADTLELRARFSAARGNLRDAAPQARALLKKNPGNPAGRLILALSQIDGDSPEERDAAESELGVLSSLETTKTEALRGLLQLALRQGDAGRARAVSERLAASPRAEFADWLARAKLVLDAEPARFEELLADLTKRAGSNPTALALVAGWMRKSGRADRVDDWIGACEALRKDAITAQMIRVEACLQQQEWERLRGILKNADWKNLNFLREVYLARALREQNRQSQFLNAWHNATAMAVKNPEHYKMLADTIRTWPGWGDEYWDFLWRAPLASFQNTPWALSELYRHYLEKKDTDSLLRVSRTILEVDSSNLFGKIHFAYYSLLLSNTPGKAMMIADELGRTHPGHPGVATVRALSLLKKNEQNEAVKLLEKLPPEALQKPDTAPVYAIALARAGKMERARQVAGAMDAGGLLPEERALLEEALQPDGPP